MKAYIQHNAINDGGETRLDADVSDVYELPTRAGVRRIADVVVTTPIGSPAHKLPRKVEEGDGREPLHLRVVRETDQVTAAWLIRGTQMPGYPGDGLVRFTLAATGQEYKVEPL